MIFHKFVPSPGAYLDNTVGSNVEIFPPCNIYGARIGDDVRIGPYVEIQRGVIIGNRVKIGSHSFLCRGVTLEDEVFIGHGVMFCNDRYPRGTTGGKLKGPGDWTMEPVHVCQGASIGTGVVILPGVRIGAGAMIGAGSVVTRDVSDGVTVCGNPARGHTSGGVDR